MASEETREQAWEVNGSMNVSGGHILADVRATTLSELAFGNLCKRANHILYDNPSRASNEKHPSDDLSISWDLLRSYKDLTEIYEPRCMDRFIYKLFEANRSTRFRHKD